MRAFSQPNQGPGVARNLGIQHATGEYVVFLDSDDLWFPWTLATYHQALHMYGKPTVVMGTPASFQRAEELAGVSRQPLRAHAFADYFASSEHPFVRTACVIAARTEALRRVGGFTPLRINGEDHDLLFRLGCERGFVWVETPRAMGYRRHAESSARDKERSFRGTVYHLEQEHAGRYPGGSARQWERRRLILASVRHVSWWLLSQGYRHWALELYRQSLWLHVRMPRWRYVLGFPPSLLVSLLRERPAPPRS